MERTDQAQHGYSFQFCSCGSRGRGNVVLAVEITKCTDRPQGCRTDRGQLRELRGQLRELQCRTHAVTSVIYSAVCIGEVTVVLDTQQTRTVTKTEQKRNVTEKENL